MSTLIRHYSKRTIAHKNVVYIKLQHLIALYVDYVINSFSFTIRKILNVFSMSVADYLKLSFIVIKNKRNQYLDFC